MSIARPKIPSPTGAEEWLARYAPHIVKSSGEPVEDALLSAVVVTWEGGWAGLKECLRSLRQAQQRLALPVEILVVDNAAPAHLASDLEGLWDRWVRFDENLGVGPGRNTGAALASAELLAFVDDDGVADKDYFENARAYFADADVLAIRGRVAPMKHPYFTALAAHYDRGPEPIEDALITEGTTVIRRALFLEAGGYPDEIYGHEGIELTYRLENLYARGRTLYAPDVVLHHDYLESWADFVNKVWRCAHNEEDARRREPDFERYLRAYAARPFPRARLTLKEEAARQGLSVLRTLLQTAAKLSRRVERR